MASLWDACVGSPHSEMGDEVLSRRMASSYLSGDSLAFSGAYFILELFLAIAYAILQFLEAVNLFWGSVDLFQNCLQCWIQFRP
jgi:hypothetical protein